MNKFSRQGKSIVAHQSLRFFYVLLTKEELTVEIAKVDGVQINDVDLAEASEDKIFQKLATNSSSAHHQNSRLMIADISRGWKSMGKEHTCLILGCK